MLYYISVIIFLPLINFFIFFSFYSNFQSIFLNKLNKLNKDFTLNFYFSYILCNYFNFLKLSIINISYSLYLIILLIIKFIIQNIFVYNFILFNWIKIGVLSINFGFIIDRISILMLFIVLFISLIVHIYSMDYMRGDFYNLKFFSYISLFTFFMLFLVTSNNLLQIFLGWEGVSLCSFLLINFWSNRIQANKSSLKAFIINRITDFFLIIGFFLIIQYTRSANLNDSFSIISYFEKERVYFLLSSFKIIDLISLFIFLGSIGKSAQIFFHTWLPDAMEGPTPVSALIHSATMVTAGIFMVIRFSPIIEYSQFTLNVILIIGCLTALYSGIVALFQYDIKKIIAFSTCSQLGYMFLSCGISGYNISLFHLFNHSFFKALLFLSSGVIIHNMGNEQDIRRFGNLYSILPVVYIVFFVGNLSLIGFPFLTGFYSKESIIELLVNQQFILGELIYWLILISVFFTSSYVFRLFFLVFFSNLGVYKKNLLKIKKDLDLMVISVVFLAFISIFVGFFFKEIFTGIGSNFFSNSFLILPQHNFKIDYHFTSTIVKLLPILCVIFGILLTFFYYKNLNVIKIFKFYELFNFFNRKFYFDKLYNDFFVNLILQISFNKFYKIFEKKIFNILGYNKNIIFFNNLSFTVLKFEKKNIINSIFLIYLISLIFLIFCFLK